MAEVIICKLCRQRRAKRACPAVHGEICAICCGEQREVTLACPLDCGFLREAHKHEKTIDIPVDQIANSDVELTEDFLHSRQELLLITMFTLMQAILDTPHAQDTDVLEALAALIQTRRTAQSGLLYESRPDNLVAHRIQQKLADSLQLLVNTAREDSMEFSSELEGDLFKLLVFLHRIGQQNLNGRPKGRMFIDMLRQMTPDTGVDERAPSIIL
jgi:hypothetical protein